MYVPSSFKPHLIIRANCPKKIYHKYKQVKLMWTPEALSSFMKKVSKKGVWLLLYSPNQNFLGYAVFA